MEADKKNQTVISSKNQEITTFFDKDSSFIFVCKKTEKLVSAIYLVTGLFSDNEPMKWTLRKKSSELLSFTINYKDSQSSSHTDFVYYIKNRVWEIVSLLEVSNKAGLISDMNFSILKQEFYGLVETLASSTGSGQSRENSIPKTFFDVAGESYSKGHSTQSSSHADKSSVHDTKEKNPLMDKTEFKRTNRQNIILGLLKKKKELTIKDIAEVITDCSEKTIQRELIAFIKAGVLKRVGERRWSKYSLA